jgi:nucleoside-diphosphate-sugar epimerase
MTAQTTILVTGATGFVGRTLLGQLLESGGGKVAAAFGVAGGFDLCAAHVVGDFTNSTERSTALISQ